MQALSHNSYHISVGKYLLCDLQGGVYKDGVVLTNPVIMSRTEGAYGPTDLGPDGIKSFFANYKMNEYCHFGDYPTIQRKFTRLVKAQRCTMWVLVSDASP